MKPSMKANGKVMNHTQPLHRVAISSNYRGQHLSDIFIYVIIQFDL